MEDKGVSPYKGISECLINTLPFKFLVFSSIGVRSEASQKTRSLRFSQLSNNDISEGPMNDQGGHYEFRLLRPSWHEEES